MRFVYDYALYKFTFIIIIITRSQRRRRKPRLRRSTIPHPVYESSFWTSQEVHTKRRTIKSTSRPHAVFLVPRLHCETSSARCSQLVHRPIGRYRRSTQRNEYDILKTSGRYAAATTNANSNTNVNHLTTILTTFAQRMGYDCHDRKSTCCK